MKVEAQILQPEIDGGILVRFEKDDLKFLYDAVDKIQQDFDNYESNNIRLAGNIERQIVLPEEIRESIDKLLTPIVESHTKTFDYATRIGRQFEGEKYLLNLVQTWAVFQKKTEFNPVHSHNGIFSFVIWLKNPYDTEDEMVQPHSRKSNYQCAGHFAYFCTNTLGDIVQRVIPTDRKMEGCAFIFPATVNHCVYPFYTSDEYRISVSGNYVIS